MKILLVSGIYPPDIGGPATFVPKLADYAAEKGCKVSILTLAKSAEETHDKNKLVKKIRRETSKLIRFPKVVFTAIKMMEDCDGVFANGLHEEIGISLIFRKRKSIAKIVGDPVWERAVNRKNTELDISNFNLRKLPPLYWVQRRLLVFSLNKFSLVTCPSEELVEIVRLWGVKTSVKMIPNGVNPVEVDSGKKDFDIVTVSRLVKWKKIDAVIRAAAIAKANLCVVGDGPELENLKKLAVSLNANVTFTGEVTEDAALAYMQKSTIYILFSLYEGLSFSLLQAMAAGNAVIVSNARGNVDVITHEKNGLIVDIDKESDLTSCIQILLANPKLRVAISDQAIKTVSEKYLLEDNLALLLNYLEIK